MLCCCCYCCCCSVHTLTLLSLFCVASAVPAAKLRGAAAFVGLSGSLDTDRLKGNNPCHLLFFSWSSSFCICFFLYSYVAFCRCLPRFFSFCLLLPSSVSVLLFFLLLNLLLLAFSGSLCGSAALLRSICLLVLFSYVRLLLFSSSCYEPSLSSVGSSPPLRRQPLLLR